uniref:Nucleotide-diphospho-sugar transferase domain-containing protein n=1 Tax=Setaria digitata TaxID=48799 RepID=A0A915PH29_9BILA
MLSKWERRGAQLFATYLVTHLIVAVMDNRTVIDPTQKLEKNSDGPLIIKDPPENLDEEDMDDNNKSVNMVNAKASQEDLVLHPIKQVTQKVPVINDEFFENFKREARIVHSKSDDFLLFTLINGAYLNLTLNWLCNVAPFRTSVHRKTLIVSLDAEACKVIQKNWKEVKCVYIRVPKDYNSPLSWGRQNYINLLTLRSQLLLILTQLELPYILFETDAVWLRDPMEFFQNQTLIDDADIVVPRKGYPDHSLTYAFDPMIVYPSNASLLFMREMNSQLSKDPKLYDQDVLDQLCRQQFFGLVCRQFDWTEVADGKWFKLSESERAHFRPYIVNNNYYVGVDSKISRQALNDLWFLSVKNNCNLSKVRSLLRKYET